MLKKLIFSTLIAAIVGFASSCKPEEGTIVPVDITVSAERVEIDSLGGTTTVTLKSNRPWSVDVVVDNPWGNENADWLTVSPMSGEASTEECTITFTAPLNKTDSINYERSVIVNFRTDKEIFASTVVYQGGIMKPNAWVYKSISDVRALAPEDKSSDERITINEPWIIKGVVVSSNNPQTVSNRNLFIQDGTDPGSGILIYSDAFSNFNFGEEVEMKVKGATLYYYFSLLQLVPASAADITATGEKSEPEAAEIENGKDFVDGLYEGQYVMLNAQVVSESLGLTMAESPKVETEDGESFLMYSRDNVPWASEKVPQGAGPLYGLCTSYNGVYQIVPQKASDFEGMTGTRFTGRPVVTTDDPVMSEDKKSVTLSGSYTYEGTASDITETGIAWMIDEEGAEYKYDKATAADNKFSITLSDLQQDATYKFMAYVKIGEREYKGSEKLFTTGGETVLTIEELTAALKELETGASLASVGTYAEGIVVGNGDGGNLYNAIAVADASGKPNSGVYLYDKSGAFASGFSIGDKVKIKLLNAKLELYNGLREVVWSSYDSDVEILNSGNEFEVPSISVAEFNTGDYQSMYVTVLDVRSDNEPGTTWVKDDKTTNTYFVDDESSKLTVRTNNHATWAAGVIASDVTGNISGIGQIYNETVQLFPNSENDIAAFAKVLSITVDDPLNLTSTSVTIGGSYVYTGSGTVTEVGIGYKEASESVFMNIAAATGEIFSVDLSGLTPETEYDYAAYVLIDGVREYSAVKSFTTPKAEETTITVAELVKALKEMEKGSSTALVATYVEGIVAGTNEDQNLYKGLSVVDGTGEAESGIFLYDNAFNSGFAVGDKVRIKLANATYDIYNDLRQLKWSAYSDDVAVLSSGNTTTTPEITAAQLAEDLYQGMFVKVTGLKASADVAGTTWGGNKKFTDGSTEITVTTYNASSWAGEYISDATGYISGVSYAKSILKPSIKDNIEDVLFGTAPEPKGLYEWILKSGDLGTATEPNSSVTIGNPELVWTLYPTWKSEGYFGFDNNNGRGLQIGSSKKPATSYAFRHELDGSMTVSEVVINASRASGSGATMRLEVDGTMVGESVTLTGDATDYTFKPTSPVSSGSIQVVITNDDKAFYVKSITFK